MKTALVLLLAVLGAGAFYYYNSTNSEVKTIEYTIVKQVTDMKFEECRNAKCTQQCEQGDSTCSHYAAQWINCYESNSACSAYQDFHAHAQPQDLLPADFFQCYEECGFIPEQFIGSLRPRFECELECSGQQVEEPASNIKIWDFESCRNTQCTQKCTEGDSECALAGSSWINCYNSNAACQEYQSFHAMSTPEDFLTAEFFQCYQECGFPASQNIGTYRPRFSCEQECSGQF